MSELLSIANKHYNEMSPHIKKRKTAELLKDLIEQNKGLLHNLDVINNELKQVDESHCSSQAWDRVYLALEFSER